MTGRVDGSAGGGGEHGTRQRPGPVATLSVMTAWERYTCRAADHEGVCRGWVGESTPSFSPPASRAHSPTSSPSLPLRTPANAPCQEGDLGARERRDEVLALLRVLRGLRAPRAARGVVGSDHQRVVGAPVGRSVVVAEAQRCAWSGEGKRIVGGVHCTLEHAAVLQHTVQYTSLHRTPHHTAARTPG